METKYGNDTELKSFLSGEKVLDMALYEKRIKTENNSAYWLLFPLVCNGDKFQYVGRSIIFLNFNHLRNFCKDLKVKSFPLGGSGHQRVSR